MIVEIERIIYCEVETLGNLTIIDDDKILFSCYTLELPDLDNLFRISCIPVGEYDVKKRYSKKYKTHFHILDVENRKFILIHHGNYYSDILGCIIVGDNLVDIDKDGVKDVTNSVKTMKKLLKILPKEFKLKIK